MRRHMLIAGTGRAGTSFLVRYLSALGLETEIERSGEAQWDETANAGLETMPLLTPGADLPYVIKTPWVAEFADHILKQEAVAIDALVIPVRDLTEAAASRIILERRAMHESAPWMADLDSTHETWGSTPGGVVYSLNPLDQARILAIDFHRLIQRFVDADTAIVFLAFPRLIHDSDYLYARLRPYLPATVTADQARAAHRALADPAKIRVEHERTSLSTSAHDELDTIALRRELQRLRKEFTDLAHLRGAPAASPAAASPDSAAADGRGPHAQETLASDELQTGQLTSRSNNLEREVSSIREALQAAEERELQAREVLASYEAQMKQLTAKLDDLASQASEAMRERDRALAQRDALLGARDSALTQRDAVIAQRERLATEHRAILAQHEALMAETSARAAAQDRLTAELQSVEERHRESFADRSRIIADGERLRAEVSALAAERARLELELGHLAAELRIVLRSRSWRFTAPLRGLVSRIKGRR